MSIKTFTHVYHTIPQIKTLPAMATPWPTFGYPNLNGFPLKLGVAKGGICHIGHRLATSVSLCWPSLGHPLATPTIRLPEIVICLPF